MSAFRVRVVLTIVASASATSIASRALKPIYATRKTISDVKFAAHATAAASHSIISEPKTVARIMNLIPKKTPSNESFFPLPLQHTAEGIERCITFTGCGGLYTYLFGVAAYMQEAFTWDAETTAFASASAGAYPAFLLASGLDIEAFHHSANREFIEAVAASPHRDPRVSPMRCWNDVLRGHWRRGITSRLSEAEIERILHNKHYVSLTHLPTLKNQLVGEFNSIDDMVEACIASGHIPIYDRHGRLGTSWRGERYVDGGVSDNAPRPFGDEVPALILGPKKWRSHAELGNSPVPFVRADWEWCNLKYKEGKADAAKHHDELAAFFE